MKRASWSLVLISLLSLAADAQKLPNTQQTSLRAPADIKTDGKTTEWNNQLQAYNHATDIYYTIANDDNKLYLTVQATDPSIVNKILRGGVAFTINTTGKKSDKGMPCITYPIFAPSDRPSVALNKKAMEAGTAKLDVVSDSVVAMYNRNLKDKSKLIEVTGIPGIDTLISVYNTDGVKAAELFDNKMAYTYELSVDLKLLGLSAGNPTKFYYHITLNGVNLVNLKKPADGNTDHAVISIASVPHDNTIMDAKISLDATGPSFVPTDLWGEYVLAKN